MCSTSVVMPKPKTSISSAEPTKAKASRTGSRRICIGLVAGVGEHPAEAAARSRGRLRRARRAAGCRLRGLGGGRRDAFVSRPSARPPRDRVLHVADEGLLQAGGAAPVDQLLRRVAGQHLPGVHERDAVAAHALVHEVRGHEDRDALRCATDRSAAPRSCRGRPDRRPRSARRGSGSAARAAPRPPARAAGAAPSAEPRPARRGARSSPNRSTSSSMRACGLVRRQVIEARVQDQVLADGQLAVERERLRHVAEVLAHLHAARLDRAAEQRRRPLRGRQQPGQHLHGRRLAAAVGAEEAEDLAALDRQRDVVDGGEGRRSAGSGRGPRSRSPPCRRRAAGSSPPCGRARFSSGSSAMKHCSRSVVPVRAISSAGVPVASTRPASMATIQSHCCASSM